MLHDGNVKRICSLKRLNITRLVNKFNRENATDAGSCRPSNLLNGHCKTVKTIVINEYITNGVLCIKTFPWNCGTGQLRSTRPSTIGHMQSYLQFSEHFHLKTSNTAMQQFLLYLTPSVNSSYKNTGDDNRSTIASHSITTTRTLVASFFGTF